MFVHSPSFFLGAGPPRWSGLGGVVLNTPSGAAFASSTVSLMSKVIMLIRVSSVAIVSKCTRTVSTPPFLACTTRPLSSSIERLSRTAKS